MDRSQDEIRAWVAEILAEHGMTATALARQAGLAPPTLARFMKGGEDVTHVLSTPTIAKIAAAVGRTSPIAPEVRMRQGVAEPELAPYRPDADRPDADARLLSALAPGHNNAHVFQLRGRALDLLGYLPGDLVIVDLNATAEPGNVVCAQIYDRQQMRAETVMRLYEPPYLLAQSSDPRYRRPEFVDNRHVVIMGVIIASARVPAAA